MSIDYSEVIGRVLKYLIEGICIALVCYFVAKLNIDQIIIISITGACCFALLDMYSPTTSNGFRLGIGLGAGSHIIGLNII